MSYASSPAIEVIPPEILSYIFVLCCPADIGITPLDKFYIQRPKQQYILGKVCSKWRKISLATPQLWNHIHIDHQMHIMREQGKYQSSESPTQILFDWLKSFLTRLVLSTTPVKPRQLLYILALTPYLVERSFAVGGIGPFATRAVDSDELQVPPYDSPHPLQLVHVEWLQLFIDDFFDCEDLQPTILPNLRHCVITPIPVPIGEVLIPRAWDAGWLPTILRSGMLETLQIPKSVLTTRAIECILLNSPYLTEVDFGSGAMFAPSTLQKMASGQL
ncbi:hypothetical protein H0H92_013503, partial [Tricholoma furcatifolium]